MNLTKIIKALEKDNPFWPEPVGTESKSQRAKRNHRNQGFHVAIEMLERIASNDKHNSFDESLHFLQSAYGITHKKVNDYHVKLYHDEYRGWFDWYHTTGTLIANRDGGANNIGKIKNDEEVAQIINKHIYGN